LKAKNAKLTEERAKRFENPEESEKKVVEDKVNATEEQNDGMHPSRRARLDALG
jgi:hypothetical protein